ncbi:MAG: aminotransferase class V-fold PLP-dependent enzyme [Candidatus Fimenecus sp.]
MKDYRSDFPILSDNGVIYFDNAATTQRPKCVIEAMKRFNDNFNANPLRGLYGWSVKATEAYEMARHTVSDFIGAGSDCEIIFTRNTTESINLVANSYGLSFLKPGDEIVITIMEHHSNILPWQQVCRKTGARLIYIYPEKNGTISDSELEKIGEKTKIVSVGMISNVLGCLNPIKKLTEMAHKNNAIILVDAAQAAPHIKIDVSNLDVDFLAFSGHKLMGPMGVGVLYGKKDLLNSMPPFLTGGEMIEYVDLYSSTFAPLPEKFEAGTVNAMGAVGLSAAIDYLNNIGFSYIEKKEKMLTEKLMKELGELPYIEIYGDEDYNNHTGIITFNIDGVHPHDVSSILDTENIAVRAGHHCAQPLMKYLNVNSTVRASMYFYNTEEEADRFITAVKNVRGWMGYGN